MTRSGDKLYGDWEKRVRGEPPRFPWRQAIRAALIVAAIVLLYSSLPGA